MSRNREASIYVGDLAENVTEEVLFEVFSSAGPIESVKCCRDVNGNFLHYGFVNFKDKQTAQIALQAMKHIAIYGRPVRVMPSIKDARNQHSGVANVFVKNLHHLVDERLLSEHFQQQGPVRSVKIVRYTSGESKGYGFVQYHRKEDAERAIEQLNNTVFCGNTLEVAQFVSARAQAENTDRVANILIKNIGDSTEDDLKALFQHFGPIRSSFLMRDSAGNSRCCGFVNFQNPDDAERAMQEMDGYLLAGRSISIEPARKRTPRPSREGFSDARPSALPVQPTIQPYVVRPYPAYYVWPGAPSAIPRPSYVMMPHPRQS